MEMEEFYSKFYKNGQPLNCVEKEFFKLKKECESTGKGIFYKELRGKYDPFWGLLAANWDRLPDYMKQKSPGITKALSIDKQTI